MGADKKGLLEAWYHPEQGSLPPLCPLILCPPDHPYQVGWEGGERDRGRVFKQSGAGGPRDKRRTYMLNEVTDNAIIKVVHLHPRYALARGDMTSHM